MRAKLLALGLVAVTGLALSGASWVSAQDEDAELVQAAAQDVSDIEAGKEPKVSQSRLGRAVLENANPSKRMRALRLLAEVMRDAELSETPANTQRQARWMKQIRAVVVSALSDSSPNVRAQALAAARALSERELPEGRDLVGPLTKRVRQDPEAELRTGAFELVLELEPDPKELRKVANIAAADADPILRARGQEVLAALASR